MDVLLINCDKTYSLDTVEDFVKRANTSEQNIRIEQRYCNVSELQAVSAEVRRRQLLLGVFVVNAYESRLSINEDKAGIGYAVLYRALLDAAQGRVVVVIGGDDRYKDGEQDKAVLSTWAYHKIAAQFDDTYLDGRRGFVFSWDERHNPVHEEALESYFKAISKGKPGLENAFTPTRPTGPQPSSELSQPPTKPTDRTRPGQPGLQQPVAPRVPLQPQKPSTSRQATTLQSTQTETHGESTRETGTVNFSKQQEHPRTHAPNLTRHSARKQNDEKTVTKFQIDVERNQGEPRIKHDSTGAVYGDPLGASPFSPPLGVNVKHTERKEHVQEQARIPQCFKALISELLSKKVEPKAAHYLKDKMEKDTEGITVKVIQIFVDGEETSRYDYPKGGDVFPIPPDIQKRISERKGNDEVVVVALYEVKPRSGELRSKFFNWDDLIDEIAQHLRGKLEKDTEGRIVKVIQIFVDGKSRSKYDYPAKEDAFKIPPQIKQSINERKDKEKYVFVVIWDDGPGKGLSTKELGFKSFNLDELICQFFDYLDIWHDV